MTKVIAISVFKGGTGKTTTAVSLAAALSSLGCKVLLIDLDQQATATKYVGLNPETENPNIYHVFQKLANTASTIRELPFGFSIIPGSSGLAVIDDGLEEGDEMMLSGFISGIKEDFDYVIIDTPPGKTMLAINALSAADEVIITLQTERPALEGVNDLIKFTHDIVFRYNSALKIRGILPTMHKKHTKHSAGVVKRARELWGDYIFPLEIPETTEFPNSFSEKKPITVSNPRHAGALAYIMLARLLEGLPLEKIKEPFDDTSDELVGESEGELIQGQSEENILIESNIDVPPAVQEGEEVKNQI